MRKAVGLVHFVVAALLLLGLPGPALPGGPLDVVDAKLDELRSPAAGAGAGRPPDLYYPYTPPAAKHNDKPMNSGDKAPGALEGLGLQGTISLGGGPAMAITDRGILREGQQLGGGLRVARISGGEMVIEGGPGGPLSIMVGGMRR